jgi:hypothetical protein
MKGEVAAPRVLLPTLGRSKAGNRSRIPLSWRRVREHDSALTVAQLTARVFWNEASCPVAEWSKAESALLEDRLDRTV